MYIPNKTSEPPRSETEKATAIMELRYNCSLYLDDISKKKLICQKSCFSKYLVNIQLTDQFLKDKAYALSYDVKQM